MKLPGPEFGNIQPPDTGIGAEGYDYLGIVFTDNTLVLGDYESEHLSENEHRFARSLAARAGFVVHRDTLIMEVWGPEYSGAHGIRNTDKSASRLRDKLDPERLSVVPSQGIGYRLIDTALGQAPIADIPSSHRAMRKAARGVPDGILLDYDWVYHRGKLAAQLRPTEASIFKLLLENVNQTVATEELRINVWNTPNLNDESRLRTATSRLRTKIADELPRFTITSQRNVGYILTDAETTA